MMKHSLLQNIPESLPEELVEVLFTSDSVRIERIVSKGHASPEGFWYNQVENEFVLLVKGRAGLSVEGQEEEIVLEEGDCLELKAHVKHRVNWTDPDQETVWLAVSYSNLEDL